MSKKRALVIYILLITTFIAVIFYGTVIYNQTKQTKNEFYVPARLVVKFKEGVTKKEIEDINASLGVSIYDFHAGTKTYYLDLPSNLSVEKAVKIYNKNAKVKYAEPEYFQYGL